MDGKGLESGQFKADDAVVPGYTAEDTVVPELVQVRQGFADRKAELMGIESPQLRDTYNLLNNPMLLVGGWGCGGACK